jgi:hypothetical protein
MELKENDYLSRRRFLRHIMGPERDDKYMRGQARLAKSRHKWLAESEMLKCGRDHR